MTGRRLPCLVPATLLGLATLSSCSDSSSRHEFSFHSGTTQTSNTRTTRSGGTVFILVTDSPRDELAAFYVTISSISLAGADGATQRVFDALGGHRVDLFALRERGTTDRLFELVVGGVELDTGEYDRIELGLSDPLFVLASGEVVEGSRIDVVDDGRVAAQLPEMVSADIETSFLVLDIDVERSLTRLDASRWEFRPRLLVEISTVEPPASVRTPIEVTGAVREIDREAGRLRFEVDGARGFVDVILDHFTPLFGPDLERTGLDAIALDALATVRGQLGEAGRLEAESMVLGETVELRGLVEGRRLTRGGVRWSVKPIAGQRFDDVVTLTTNDETRLSWARSGEAATLDLRVGTLLSLRGKRQPGIGETIAAIHVDVEPTSPMPGARTAELSR